MIKVGIVGGTGYTGVELLRILVRHPDAEVTVATSRSDAGSPVSELYPSLRGYIDIPFRAPEIDVLACCDVVFFATPNGTAMRMAPALLEHGVKVIDLSADFRLEDPDVWAHWYGEDHACSELLPEAVYGLPELNRRRIADARLVACPGCYPTAVQLGFMPLIESGSIDLGHLIADVKSGVSGAGRKAEVSLLMSEAGESFKAYSVGGHRHLPEIRQGLQRMAKSEVALTFVPHLTPMIRGIHATLYARVRASSLDLQSLYESRYAEETFVNVLGAGAHPDTRSVRGSNACQIAVHRPQGGDDVVVLSVIDNLVKGAAGQAVQNMNLMFGLNEATGLEIVPLYP